MPTKKILFFDTETAGLQTPAICQIGIIYGEYTAEGQLLNEEKIIDKLFNPGMQISAEASNVHGLYNKDLEKELYFETFLTEFVELVNSADYIVGHNVQFDIKAIRYEIYEFFKARNTPIDRKTLNFIKKMEDKTICTMQNSIELCKLPGNYGKYKWPKLNELHLHLFGTSFDNAHNAMADIIATQNCFFELVKKEHIKI